MHIALVTHHYAPEHGAPQRRWAAFTRRFIAAGHQVTVLTPPPHYPSGRAGELTADVSAGAVTEGALGERIIRVRFREHNDSLISRSLDQAVSALDSFGRGLHHFRQPSRRPDVVIATAPGLPSIPAGMALGSMLRRPTVVEMRDAWPDLIAPSGMMGPDDASSPGGAKRFATRFAHERITHLQRNTAAVVTTTESFAEVLRNRGVHDPQVIRNGSTVELLPIMGPPPMDRSGLRVLYLGTMGRSQGLGTAIQAAKLAAAHGLKITLRFVGSGADDEVLRAQADALRAPVEFVSRCTPAEVAEHYEWADTSLVMLRGWGPFDWTVPSKLYEIMAVRRHVSASLNGEAARVVQEAEAGFVTAPEDATALAHAWLDLAAHREKLDVGNTARTWVINNVHHALLAARYLDLLHHVADR